MRRRLMVAAALTLTVVVVVMVATRRGGPQRPATAPVAGVSTGERGGPAPVTGAHSEDGARAAALSVATASQDWLYLSDAQVDAAVRERATSEAGPALAAETVATLGQARRALAASPGRVWWLVRPLATHVAHYDTSRARVVVWTVTVLSATDVALPQADWMRVAVDLVWRDGAWRCEAVTDTPGPTPAVGAKDRPWQAAAFDDSLDGFERVGSKGATP